MRYDHPLWNIIMSLYRYVLDHPFMSSNKIMLNLRDFFKRDYDFAIKNYYIPGGTINNLFNLLLKYDQLLPVTDRPDDYMIEASKIGVLAENTEKAKIGIAESRRIIEQRENLKLVGDTSKRLSEARRVLLEKTRLLESNKFSEKEKEKIQKEIEVLKKAVCETEREFENIKKQAGL